MWKVKLAHDQCESGSLSLTVCLLFSNAEAGVTVGRTDNRKVTHPLRHLCGIVGVSTVKCWQVIVSLRTHSGLLVDYVTLILFRKLAMSSCKISEMRTQCSLYEDCWGDAMWDAGRSWILDEVLQCESSSYSDCAENNRSHGRFVSCLMLHPVLLQTFCHLASSVPISKTQLMTQLWGKNQR